MPDLYYAAERVTLYHGDCLEVMRGLPANSIDAIVTDPPAGIAFMGKAWDRDHGGRDHWIAWMSEIAAEALRLSKPGSHALVWALPRTSHWTATAWEDAGWQVRDRVSHLFGSGFPKSLDVSKAIDRYNGDERPVHGTTGLDGARFRAFKEQDGTPRAPQSEYITSAASAASAAWEGWGTALKPAMEDWWLLRKPLDGNVAHNVLTWGTGGLNIDGCRDAGMAGGNTEREPAGFAHGRWPAHVTLDEEAARLLDAQSGQSGQSGERLAFGLGDGTTLHGGGSGAMVGFYGDVGGASRFFYTAKSPRDEREAGLEPAGTTDVGTDGVGATGVTERAHTVRANTHPTVKPLDLMRWLCRLVTTPQGTILDCFLGSGTTAMAALDEGFSCIGIEREAQYIAIAQQRIAYRHMQTTATRYPTLEREQGRLF